MQLQRRKKQYWVTFHFWTSQLWQKHIGVPSNQKSDIKQAIKMVQPTCCPLCCVTDSLHCVISRPDCLWLLRFYYLPLCTWWPFGIHHESGWVLSVWTKKNEKKNTHSGQPDFVVIFKCQMVKHITVRLKHVEQNSFRGLHLLIQQLSQRFCDVRENNINF